MAELSWMPHSWIIVVTVVNLIHSQPKLELRNFWRTWGMLFSVRHKKKMSQLSTEDPIELPQIIALGLRFLRWIEDAQY